MCEQFGKRFSEAGAHETIQLGVSGRIGKGKYLKKTEKIVSFMALLFYILFYLKHVNWNEMQLIVIRCQTTPKR